MKHIVKHNLSPEAAKKVAHSAYSSYKKRLSQYNPTIEWVDDTCAKVSFRVHKTVLKGKVVLEPKAIIFHFNVPLLMRPFMGRATKVLDQEVNSWIEKSKQE